MDVFASEHVDPLNRTRRQAGRDGGSNDFQNWRTNRGGDQVTLGNGCCDGFWILGQKVGAARDRRSLPCRVNHVIGSGRLQRLNQGDVSVDEGQVVMTRQDNTNQPSTDVAGAEDGRFHSSSSSSSSRRRQSGKHFIDARRLPKLLTNIFVHEHFGELAQQSDVIVRVSGKADHEIRRIVAPWRAIRVLAHHDPGFQDRVLAFKGSVRHGHAVTHERTDGRLSFVHRVHIRRRGQSERHQMIAGVGNGLSLGDRVESEDDVIGREHIFKAHGG